MAGEGRQAHLLQTRQQKPPPQAQLPGGPRPGPALASSCRSFHHNGVKRRALRDVVSRIAQGSGLVCRSSMFCWWREGFKNKGGGWRVQRQVPWLWPSSPMVFREWHGFAPPDSLSVLCVWRLEQSHFWEAQRRTRPRQSLWPVGARQPWHPREYCPQHQVSVHAAGPHQPPTQCSCTHHRYLRQLLWWDLGMVMAPWASFPGDWEGTVGSHPTNVSVDSGKGER